MKRSSHARNEKGSARKRKKVKTNPAFLGRVTGDCHLRRLAGKHQKAQHDVKGKERKKILEKRNFKQQRQRLGVASILETDIKKKTRR